MVIIARELPLVYQRFCTVAFSLIFPPFSRRLLSVFEIKAAHFMLALATIQRINETDEPVIIFIRGTGRFAIAVWGQLIPDFRSTYNRPEEGRGGRYSSDTGG